ncbi:MAG: ascorbate-dependent monooxygenase [bacterium]|nr:ascorbate-dependent monooxygenase [bacterium]
MKRLTLVLGWAVAQLPAAETPVPTWSRDIAPVIYENCVPCHRPGQVAPFSLLDYADVAKRARFIARAVKSHYMPPWSPDGPVGAFIGERGLTEEKIALLAAWAAAGAPAGDLAAVPAPPPGPTAGWELGQPDLIVRMPRPYAVPRGPDNVYMVFPMPFSLKDVAPAVLARARIPDSDALAVAAVEIHPGNRRVFHHADVWVDLTGQARKREAAEGGTGYLSFGTPGFPPAIYLGGRVPGITPRFLPDGIAASVLPVEGGDLALQVHYAPTGKPETDQSEIGIYFMREPVKRVLESVFLRSFNLDIPAGAAAFTVEDTLEIPADCMLLSVFPHMHLLGREVQADALLPDGTRRELLTVRHWSFPWQDRYFYKKPVFLPKGTRVHCRWVFDNSDGNKQNPHVPAQPVRFGPNATDEMCEFHLGIVPVNLAEAELFPAAREQKMRQKIDELSPAQRARVNWKEAVER